MKDLVNFLIGIGIATVLILVFELIRYFVDEWREARRFRLMLELQRERQMRELLAVAFFVGIVVVAYYHAKRVKEQQLQQ